MPQHLTSSFSYQAPGRIWQLKTDEAASCLCIEVRNELQEVSFSYICPLQDKIFFEGLTVEGGMLTQLVACHNKVMLLQQYTDLNNPIDVTTLGIDAESTEVLWAVTNYRHHFFSDYLSIGRAGQTEEEEEVWVALGLADGVVQDLSATHLEKELHAQRKNITTNSAVFSPAWYEEDSSDFTAVSEFLQLYLQEKPQKACEYLHVFDKIMISFYTADGEKLSNKIAVFNEEGSLLLHQFMAGNLQQPGSDTFMVWNKHLLFLENSSCLKGYNLQ